MTETSLSVFERNRLAHGGGRRPPTPVPRETDVSHDSKVAPIGPIDRRDTHCKRDLLSAAPELSTGNHAVGPWRLSVEANVHLRVVRGFESNLDPILNSVSTPAATSPCGSNATMRISSVSFATGVMAADSAFNSTSTIVTPGMNIDVLPSWNVTCLGSERRQR